MYEYYCIKCNIKITTDEPGMVTCPTCKSGSDIMDYGDYDPPLYDNFKDDYNWNKP